MVSFQYAKSYRIGARCGMTNYSAACQTRLQTPELLMYLVALKDTIHTFVELREGSDPIGLWKQSSVSRWSICINININSVEPLSYRYLVPSHNLSKCLDPSCSNRFCLVAPGHQMHVNHKIVSFFVSLRLSLLVRRFWEAFYPSVNPSQLALTTIRLSLLPPSRSRSHQAAYSNPQVVL